MVWLQFMQTGEDSPDEHRGSLPTVEAWLAQGAVGTSGNLCPDDLPGAWLCGEVAPAVGHGLDEAESAAPAGAGVMGPRYRLSRVGVADREDDAAVDGPEPESNRAEAGVFGGRFRRLRGLGVLNCVGGQLRDEEPSDFDPLVGEAPALEDVDGVAAGPGDGVGGGGEGQFADGRGAWFMQVAPSAALPGGCGTLWRRRRPASPGRLWTGHPGLAGCLEGYFVATT